jgi:hypothetical protein
MSFNIKLIKWTISNLKLLKNSNIKTDLQYDIKLAKNLKSQISEIYKNYIIRNENLKEVLIHLA